MDTSILIFLVSLFLGSAGFLIKMWVNFNMLSKKVEDLSKNENSYLKIEKIERDIERLTIEIEKKDQKIEALTQELQKTVNLLVKIETKLTIFLEEK